MIRDNNFSSKLTVVEPFAGSRLEDCKEEAKALALGSGGDVMFSFNGIVHRYIRGDDVFVDSAMVSIKDPQVVIK